MPPCFQHVPTPMHNKLLVNPTNRCILLRRMCFSFTQVLRDLWYSHCDYYGLRLALHKVQNLCLLLYDTSQMYAQFKKRYSTGCFRIHVHVGWNQCATLGSWCTLYVCTRCYYCGTFTFIIADIVGGVHFKVNRYIEIVLLCFMCWLHWLCLHGWFVSGKR